MTISALDDLMVDARLVEKKTQRDSWILYLGYFAFLAGLALFLG